MPYYCTGILIPFNSIVYVDPAYSVNPTLTNFDPELDAHVLFTGPKLVPSPKESAEPHIDPSISNDTSMTVDESVVQDKSTDTVEPPRISIVSFVTDVTLVLPLIEVFTHVPLA